MTESNEKKLNKKKKGKKDTKVKKKKIITLDKIFWILAIIVASIVAYVGKDFDWNAVLNTTDANFNNVEITFDLFGEANTTVSETETNIDPTKENLKIYFIDVGQADSTLVIDNDKTMLIDAGTNDQGENVVQFLKNKGITKIDYLIGTHPHEDHIGGLDNVIDTFDIGTIYMPKVQTNTKTFESVLDSISNKGLKITTPNVNDIFKLSDAECQIMSTVNDESNLNLSSIVIRMTYGEQSYLFMGDAEKENEQTRNWPQTNVLKVGHHGSDTSTTKNFLSQVKPEIAIISVGKDNSYGHPKQIVLDKLSNIGAEIYRTDTSGTILVTSNGVINKVETNIK